MKSVVLQEFICNDMPVPSCHASTIAETPNGLVASFFAGTHEGHQDVGIWVARKPGDAWSPPREVIDGEKGRDQRCPCYNPVLYQEPDGPLLLWYHLGPKCSDLIALQMESNDDGESWTEPRKLPARILGPIKNKPIRQDGGALLCPSSCEETGWQVFVERTEDLGKTWSKVGPLNDAKEMCAIQPSFLPYPNGRMQLVCRTRQKHIAESWSEDEGRSWSAMKLMMLPNPNSGIDAVMLRDGRALLVYNHSAGRTPLNVAFSEDGAKWFAAEVLEDEPGEYSYPAIIQTADDLVHITYTWKREKVRHVVLDPKQLDGTEITDGAWPAGS